MMVSRNPDFPLHPGVLLKATITQLERPLADIARMIGLSRQTLHGILVGKQGLTPRIALRLAKLTGTPVEAWLKVQQAYDLHQARERDAEFLAEMPVLGERW